MMAGSLALVTPLAAQEEPRVRLRVGYAVQTDSNLFRLPAGTDTMSLLGTSSGSDRIGITTLGANFQTRQGLQSFRLDASVVDYKYQKFSHLSFTGTNYNLAWLWALTPRLTGSLMADRKETLNSYTDYQGYSLRNERLDTSTHFNLVYEIDGPWRLLTGVSQARQSNQQALIAGGDFSSSSAHVGLRHVYASGSTLSYRWIASDGRYLNRTLSSQALLDDRYTQSDHELRFHGVMGDGMHLDAHLTHISREHPHFPQRDFSGVNAGTSFNWALSSKTTLALSYARELGAYATSYSNYSQADRLSLSPVWLISARTQLGLRHSGTRIDFLGSPTGGAPSNRQDTWRDTTLFFSWQPRDPWTLMTSVQRQRRNSTLAGLDFETTLVSLSAQYSF